MENGEKGRRKTHPWAANGTSLESLYSMAGSLAAAQARTYSRTQRLFGLLAVSTGTSVASRGVPAFLDVGAVFEIASSGLDVKPVSG